jgi:hypothetical protein
METKTAIITIQGNEAKEETRGKRTDS